MTLINNPMKQ